MNRQARLKGSTRWRDYGNRGMAESAIALCKETDLTNRCITGDWSASALAKETTNGGNTWQVEVRDEEFPAAINTITVTVEDMYYRGD
jgi:hypothetical protein